MPCRACCFMLAEVPVHVIQRGHNRAACFFEAADYSSYLEQLGVLADKFPTALCMLTV